MPAADNTHTTWRSDRMKTALAGCILRLLYAPYALADSTSNKNHKIDGYYCHVTMDNHDKSHDELSVSLSHDQSVLLSQESWS